MAAAQALAGTPTLASLRADHPRLLFTPEVEKDLRIRLASDPLLARMVARVQARSDVIASEPPTPFASVPHEEFGIQMLSTSRRILEHVTTHGLMYRITGEQRYADRLWREMDAALSYPTWNPAIMLDASEMLMAVAFAYDWGYNAWTPQQRQRLREAMKERVFKRGLEIYETRQGLSAFFVTATSNWNAVPNASMIAGALAMAEDEPALAQRVLDYAVPSIAYSRQSYAPDGASEEGVTYWGYGADYYTLAIATMESALGTSADLLDSPGLRNTASFRLHAQSPTGRNFTYADCWPRTGASIGYAFLSSRFGPAPARQHVRTLLEHDIDVLGQDDGLRLLPLAALWLPPAAAASGAATPLDAFFGGPVELAMFRSSWTDPGAAYLGFKAGHADHGHNHLDLGSFLYDQDGVRWSADLGPENYAVAGYFRKETNEHFKLTPENAHQPNRWSYLRTINQGHSTLTVGDALISRTAVAPMTVKGSTPQRAFAVADLSQAYPGGAQGWQRGVALVQRQWLAVRDELTGLRPQVAVDWNMLSEAKVQVAADGRSAWLSRDGKRMRLVLAAAPPGARLSASPATPKTREENQNQGVTRVNLHWNATTPDAVFEVHLVPASLTGETPLQGALAGWQR